MSRFTNVHSLLKFGRWAHKHHYKLLTTVVRVYMRVVCTCDIPFEARISDTVHFNHNGFGIVINPRCRIGEYTDIQHNVTIGEIEGGGSPTIGRNVYIGARAILLGDITVGDHAIIGAGSVVLTDVPPHAVVVGVPGRVIKINRTCM